MINITKEIKVVEQVISLLYQCLKINIETCNKVGIKSCLKDIKTCKRELQRLKEIEYAVEVTKGAFIDVLQ